jgi:hypothetical protein
VLEVAVLKAILQSVAETKEYVCAPNSTTLHRSWMFAEHSSAGEGARPRLHRISQLAVESSQKAARQSPPAINNSNLMKAIPDVPGQFEA